LPRVDGRYIPSIQYRRGGKNTMADYDLVVRNGTLATASDVFRADIGISDGRIATIGAKLAPGRREINAEGRIVAPGGVDSHCHIEQLSSMGVMTASFPSPHNIAACRSARW
jgi:dihydropyrimidinase